MQNYYLPCAFWKSFRNQSKYVVKEARLLLMFFLLARSRRLPSICVVLPQLRSAHHAGTLPFWQNMFGSKAIETGAFRTAWAPGMSLTEAKIWTHLLRTKCTPSEDSPVEPYASWTLLPRWRFALPSCQAKDAESPHQCSLPSASLILWLGAASASRLLAWVFSPWWSSEQMQPGGEAGPAKSHPLRLADLWGQRPGWQVDEPRSWPAGPLLVSHGCK